MLVNKDIEKGQSVSISSDERIEILDKSDFWREFTGNIKIPAGDGILLRQK